VNHEHRHRIGAMGCVRSRPRQRPYRHRIGWQAPVPRYCEVGQDESRCRVFDPLHGAQGGGETIARVYCRKFKRFPIDAEIVSARRKNPQRLIGVDDSAIVPKQRDAVGQKIERVFQSVGVTGKGDEAGSHVVCSLKMRTQTLHQLDVAVAGVTLSAATLNRDGGDLLRRLFEHGGNEIAHVALRQEFRIEGVPCHGALIEQLVIPTHSAGPL
jgi:hypothetical protein